MISFEVFKTKKRLLCFVLHFVIYVSVVFVTLGVFTVLLGNYPMTLEKAQHLQNDKNK